MNEYKKLDKSLSEDIETLKELATAMNERNALQKRLSYLNQLIDDNSEIKSSIWTTMQGVSMPISQITDDHLKNIGMYLVKRGSSNPRIYKEIVNRFGVEALPSGLSSEEDDEDEDDYEDIFR